MRTHHHRPNLKATTMLDIAAANAFATGKPPQDLVRYAIEGADGGAVVSTNFRPGEAVILHMCAQVQPDIPVLWVDHGYNTDDTYRFADQVIKQLGLNVQLFVPQRTRAHREAVAGALPDPDTPEHDELTKELKLEPFQRGLRALAPTVWLTAVRREQTAFRAGMTYFDQEQSGLIETPLVKVAPLLDWTEADMAAYLTQHKLPDETVYFDPTKVHGNRECGLHPGKG